MGKKTRKRKSMDKTLSLPGTGASKTRKTLTGLAAAAVLGAGLYTLFGPGRLLTGADPGNEFIPPSPDLASVRLPPMRSGISIPVWSGSSTEATRTSTP